MLRIPLKAEEKRRATWDLPGGWKDKKSQPRAAWQQIRWSKNEPQCGHLKGREKPGWEVAVSVLGRRIEMDTQGEFQFGSGQEKQVREGTSSEQHAVRHVSSQQYSL